MKGLVFRACLFSGWFLSGYGGFVWQSEVSYGLLVLYLALGGFIMLCRVFSCIGGV